MYLDLDETQQERLRACLPRTGVFPFLRGGEEAIHQSSDGFEFSTDWGPKDSAIDAADALERLLEHHGLRERVTVSLGGGELWISGARRHDVERVRELIRSTR